MSDQPPFGGNWNRIYVTVVVYVCLLIVLLYWMTIEFNH